MQLNIGFIGYSSFVSDWTFGWYMFCNWTQSNEFHEKNRGWLELPYISWHLFFSFLFSVCVSKVTNELTLFLDFDSVWIVPWITHNIKYIWLLRKLQLIIKVSCLVLNWASPLVLKIIFYLFQRECKMSGDDGRSCVKDKLVSSVTVSKKFWTTTPMTSCYLLTAFLLWQATGKVNSKGWILDTNVQSGNF